MQILKMKDLTVKLLVLSMILQGYLATDLYSWVPDQMFTVG